MATQKWKLALYMLYVGYVSVVKGRVTGRGPNSKTVKLYHADSDDHMSCVRRKGNFTHMRNAKAEFSMRIRAGWSGPSLFTWGVDDIWCIVREQWRLKPDYRLVNAFAVRTYLKMMIIIIIIIIIIIRVFFCYHDYHNYIKYSIFEHITYPKIWIKLWLKDKLYRGWPNFSLGAALSRLTLFAQLWLNETAKTHLFLLFIVIYYNILLFFFNSPCITKRRLFKYTENFTTKKNENLQIKHSDIFLISAQKIDCGYSLEPPRRCGSNEYPQSMLLSRNKKKNVYLCKPQFCYKNVGFKGVKIL